MSTPSRMPGQDRLNEIFQILRDGDAWTRSALAAATGLSRSTIAARVDTLMGMGFVKQVGASESTGGRPSAQIAFNADARIALAIDLGQTHARLAVTNLAATVLARKDLEVVAEDGPEAVLSVLARAGRQLIRAVGRQVDDLVGVGIGVPTAVEHDSGTPSTPLSLQNWDGFDIPARLGRVFDVPILVDNDVNIMALGERMAFWPTIDDLLFVKAATGIGAGVVSSGSLQRGAHGFAGDLGHVRLFAPELGRTVRLGDVASGTGIAEQLSASGLPVPDVKSFVELVRSGSPEAGEVLRLAGRRIGEALVNMICLLNPAVIVLGGALAHAGEELLAGVRETVYSESMPFATVRLQIVRSSAGDDAGVLGAAQMVIDEALRTAVVRSATG